jgi:hypothetical protein
MIGVIARSGWGWWSCVRPVVPPVCMNPAKWRTVMMVLPCAKLSAVGNKYVISCCTNWGRVSTAILREELSLVDIL